MRVHDTLYDKASGRLSKAAYVSVTAKSCQSNVYKYRADGFIMMYKRAGKHVCLSDTKYKSSTGFQCSHERGLLLECLECTMLDERELLDRVLI